MPRHEASEGAGGSPRGPELCSGSRSCRERFHCVILGWPSGKARSLWHLCMGLGRQRTLLGRPQRLRSLLQPGAPARRPAERAALSPGASVPRQCPLPRNGRKGSSSTSRTPVLRGRGRCRSCLWWFLGAHTPNVGTAPFPMLPLWARASSPLSA